MKRYLCAAALSAGVLLTSCAAAPEFRSSADEMLYRSIIAGDIEAVATSVADGANIDRLRRGRFVNINMVEFAADMGHMDIAEWLIESGADVNHKTSVMGETLLMSMAAAGEYDFCRLLLKHGADIGAKNRLFDTALEYAFMAPGSVSEPEIDMMVTMLLENGAQIERRTLIAALSGHSGSGDGDGRYGLVRRVVLDLREHGVATRLNPAVEAAILGDGVSALALIAEGRLSVRDKEQILFYTAAFGEPETLQRLESKGLSLGGTDRDGSTLLIIAARYGNEPVVRHLIHNGADVDARNRSGKTAADSAVDDAIAAFLEMGSYVYGTYAAVDACVCRCVC